MAGLERELKRGTLEMVLLSLLGDEPKYGYQLVAEIDERTQGAFGIKEGTLYPVLYRLEDRGLVVPEWSTPARGVPRKYYRATAEGRARLRSLCREWRGFVTAIGELIGPSSAKKESQS